MTSHMSYTKNAVAFEKLVGICAGYEGKYNPARQNLSTTSLRTLADQATVSNRAVAEARLRYVNAAARRDEAFLALRETLKRLRSEIHLLSVDDGTRDLLITAINKAAVSKYVSHRPEPDQQEVPKPKRTNLSQDGASRLAAFQTLIDTLALVSDYRPSAEDLSVPALQSHAAGLKAHLQSVIDAGSALNMARGNRRRVYTHPETGVLAVAQDVKYTVNSIFGSSSAELAEVKMVQFR